MQVPAPSPVSQPQPALRPTPAPAAASSALAEPPSRSSLSSRSSGGSPTAQCQPSPEKRGYHAESDVDQSFVSRHCRGAKQLDAGTAVYSGMVDGAGEDGEPFLAHSSSPLVTPEHVRKPSAQSKAEVRSPEPEWPVSAPVSAVCDDCITWLFQSSRSPARGMHLCLAGHRCRGAQHRPGRCIIQPTPADRIAKDSNALLDEPRTPVSAQCAVSIPTHLVDGCWHGISGQNPTV